MGEWQLIFTNTKLCLESYMNMGFWVFPQCQQASYPFSGDQTMNMLGVIQVYVLYMYLGVLMFCLPCHLNRIWQATVEMWQSQKTAELLLDLKVSSIISSPKKACVEMAAAISSVSRSIIFCLHHDITYTLSNGKLYIHVKMYVN